jgi:hypothetical protein
MSGWDAPTGSWDSGEEPEGSRSHDQGYQQAQPAGGYRTSRGDGTLRAGRRGLPGYDQAQNYDQTAGYDPRTAAYGLAYGSQEASAPAWSGADDLDATQTFRPPQPADAGYGSLPGPGEDYRTQALGQPGDDQPGYAPQDYGQGAPDYQTEVYPPHGFESSGYAQRGYADQDHGPSGYDRNGYGQASGGTGTGYQRDSYGQGAYAQDGYGQNGTQAGYVQDGYGQGGYSPDAYRQEAYGQGAHRQDGYGQDAYRQDGYGQEAYGQGGYSPDAYRQESYGQESYGQESYGQESYGQESYRQDAYRQDGYGQEAYGQGAHRQDGYGQEAQGHEAYDQGGYSPDAYRQEAHGQHAYRQDGYGEDGYGPEAYRQDAYGQGGYGQDAYAQPGIDRTAGPAYGDGGPGAPAPQSRSGRSHSAQRSPQRLSRTRMVLYLLAAILGVVLIVWLVINLTKNGSTTTAGNSTTTAGSTSSPSTSPGTASGTAGATASGKAGATASGKAGGTAAGTGSAFVLTKAANVGPFPLNPVATNYYVTIANQQANPYAQAIKAKGAGVPGKEVVAMYNLSSVTSVWADNYMAIGFVGYNGTFKPDAVIAYMKTQLTSTRMVSAGPHGGQMMCGYYLSSSTGKQASECLWVTPTTFGMTQFIVDRAQSKYNGTSALTLELRNAVEVKAS